MEENKYLIIENIRINTPMSDSRIDNSELYSIPNNVQVLSIFCNIEKYFKEDYDEEGNKINIKKNKNIINYSFLHRFINLEALYICSKVDDGLVTFINQWKVKLPETLKVLVLSELDYCYKDLNFNFLKYLPNLEAIYLHCFKDNENFIYKNNVKKIKANLINPEKTKIFNKSDFEDCRLPQILLQIVETVFKGYYIEKERFY